MLLFMFSPFYLGITFLAMGELFVFAVITKLLMRPELSPLVLKMKASGLLNCEAATFALICIGKALM